MERRHIISLSIRGQLILLVLIAVLPALVIILYQGIERNKDEVEEAYDRALFASKTLTVQHEHVTANIRQTLRTLSQDEAVLKGTSGAWEIIYRDFISGNPLYRIISIADSRGRIYASTSPFDELSVADRKYFRDAVESGMFSAGEYAVGYLTKAPSLHFAYPVIDGDSGRVTSVLIATLNLDIYETFLKELSSLKSYVYVITDHRGIRLFRHPDANSALTGIGVAVSETSMRHLLGPSDEGVYEGAGSDGTLRIYAFKRMRLHAEAPPYLCIFVGADKSTFLEEANTVLLQSVVFLCSAAALALLAAWYLGNFAIAARLKKLAAAADRLRSGDMTARTGLSYTNDAIGELAESFDGMALALEIHTTERQRAEKALRESEHRFSTAFRSNPEAIAITSADDLKIVMVNDQWLKTLGYTREEVIGRSTEELGVWTSREERALVVDSIRERNAFRKLPVHVRTKSGEIREVLLYGEYMDEQGGDLILTVAHDVTEERKAARDLEESEERYRRLFDTANDGIFIMRDERFVDCNAKALEMFNCAKAEILGTYPWQFSPGHQADGRPSMEKAREFMQMSMDGKAQNFAWRHLRHDGPIIETEISLNGFSLKGERFLQAVVRDVTDRTRAQEMYRTLSEMSFAGVYIIQDGIFIFVNHTASSYSGFADSCHPDQGDHGLIGMPALSIVHPEDRQGVRALSREMVKGLRTTPYEYRIVTRNGETRWIMETVASIHHEGRPAILGTAMDITEMKTAQKELEHIKALESSILSAIPHAVMGVRNRDIIFANEGTENVFGWNRSELIQKSTRILFRSDEAYEDFGRSIYSILEKKKTESRDFDAHFMHKDGRNLICRVTASIIGEELTDRYITTTIEDVTNLRNVQMQLLQSEKMSSIGQLAAGVAHEINNPTGYVSSNLRTLEEYFKCIGSVLTGYEGLLGRIEEGLCGERPREALLDQAHAVEAIKTEVDLDYILNDVPNLLRESRQGAERIREIVLDLKNFAHPGKEEFKHADIVKNIESTLNVVWNELKYKATIHKDYGELPPVMCIPQQLNQVFMNILVNAAQAIKGKGEIAIKTRRRDGHVEISIRDTGCGIPKANISKIFEPFFTTKEVGKGTGLGLNVAYNVVRKHNGTIDVESGAGQGTTFIVKIPVEQTLESAEGHG
jgi:PAS domain S-box-containing protein